MSVIASSGRAPLPGLFCSEVISKPSLKWVLAPFLYAGACLCIAGFGHAMRSAAGKILAECWKLKHIKEFFLYCCLLPLISVSHLQRSIGSIR